LKGIEVEKNALIFSSTFCPTFRMDLHGNIEKKEAALDGSQDGNMFDIHQGVSVCLLLKAEEMEK
jgi:hypothetical protein